MKAIVRFRPTTSRIVAHAFTRSISGFEDGHILVTGQDQIDGWLGQMIELGRDGDIDHGDIATWCICDTG